MSVHALLLNASYEPIRVISVRRAVTLLVAGKAEVLEVSNGAYHSATQTLRVPSVLRLKYQVKIPFRSTVPLTRKALSARDGKTCQYCFKAGDTIDHVVPRSRGGEHVWSNVVIACKRCNTKKADKLLSELGWTLPVKPHAPRAWFYVVFQVELDEAWLPYLPQAA